MGISISKLIFNQDIPIKKIKTVKMEIMNQVITANNKYIIIKSEKNVLHIKDLETEKFYSIQLNSRYSFAQFHPKLEDIFLMVDGKIIKIFVIVKEPFECKEKVKVEEHSSTINIAEFSKNDDKIFATYSDYNSIKIWSIDQPVCICNILVNN